MFRPRGTSEVGALAIISTRSNHGPRWLKYWSELLRHISGIFPLAPPPFYKVKFEWFDTSPFPPLSSFAPFGGGR